MTLASAVGEAAAKWELARQEVCRLKAQRASYECEDWAPNDPETGGGVPKCWQVPPDEQPGVATWCEPCRLRQEIHQHIAPAMKRERLARRRLIYIAAKYCAEIYGKPAPPSGAGKEK